MRRRSDFSTPSSTLAVVCLLDYSHPGGCGVVSPVNTGQYQVLNIPQINPLITNLNFCPDPSPTPLQFTKSVNDNSLDEYMDGWMEYYAAVKKHNVTDECLVRREDVVS